MRSIHIEYVPSAVEVWAVDLLGPVEIAVCRTEPELTAAVNRLQAKHGIRPPDWKEPADHADEAELVGNKLRELLGEHNPRRRRGHS